MSLDRQAAKAAGYTDAEIDAYEAEQKQKGAPATQVGGTEPPPPPPPSATQNEASNVNYGELAATMGMAAAPYVLPTAGAAVAGGAGYGLYKFGKGVLESGRDISQAMRERTALDAVRESRIANRPGMGGPTPTPTGPQLVGPSGQPLPASTPAPVSGPVAPNPTANQPSIAERVRQIAASKVQGMANYSNPIASAIAPVARAASGIGGMLYSPGLNTGEAEQLAEYRRRTGQQP
jgi:hypothetical protein